MTIEEKAAMMSGKNMWETVNHDHIGIASIFLADGPHGLRKQVGAADHLGINKSIPATCYPTAATIANSWDQELGEELGKFLGQEAQTLGVQMLLGPGMNIKRNPLCGRNFEYFSEDPYLTGKMAAAYIKGIQSQGVAACPKHFAANNQELKRMASDSIIDERTLREIYLTGFEIAVKESRPKGIMSAYNRINGVYANENAFLLQKVLVDEWGFDGIVVSDWGGSNDHVLGIKNGSHLEMPSIGKMGISEICEAIDKGILKEVDLDQRVDELLSVVLDLNRNAGKKKLEIKMEESHAFARKAAKESIVLLKNDRGLLPLKKKAQLCVIGEFADKPRYQGAGSSLVNASQVDDALSFIKESKLDFTGYARGYIRNEKTHKNLIKEAIELAQRSDIVLLYIGLDEASESEGMDRAHMSLPQNQLDLIHAITNVHKKVVVILSAGSVVEMPWINKVGALLHGYLSGQAGAGGMVDVLLGKYCPSGRLNETYPLDYKDIPSAGNFPSNEKSAEYREGLYVGYRYFDKLDKPVLYPFGYGLSYTSFDYNSLQVTDHKVTFEIRNTGDVDGYEIPQLYVSKKESDIFRPKKELKGFKKVWISAGESVSVNIAFDEMTFRVYDPNTSKWLIEKGVYQICIGKNVNEIILKEEIFIDGVILSETYKSSLLKSYYTGEVQKVTDACFEELLARKLPNTSRTKEQDLGINDTFSQLNNAKSWLGRFVYWILNGLINRSEKKGKANLNILFVYNMTFRALAKMSAGKVSKKMVLAMLDVFNGYGIKAYGRLIKETIWRK